MCSLFLSTSEQAKSSTKFVKGIFCVVGGSKHGVKYVVLIEYTSEKTQYRILTTGVMLNGCNGLRCFLKTMSINKGLKGKTFYCQIKDQVKTPHDQ